MKIQQAEFKEAVTINGTKVLGALGINPSKYPGVKLSYGEYGLIVEAPDGAGRLIVAIIPTSNLRMSIVAESDAAKALFKPFVEALPHTVLKNSKNT